MKETTKKQGTLALVSEHQTTGWELGSDYDVDFEEYVIVADDLRALAGRAGYAQAGNALQNYPSAGRFLHRGFQVRMVPSPGQSGQQRMM